MVVPEQHEQREADGQDRNVQEHRPDLGKRLGHLRRGDDQRQSQREHGIAQRFEA